MERLRADVMEKGHQGHHPPPSWTRTPVLYRSTSRFVVGGPQGDTGLTGRRSSSIPNGAARHGGGAFSRQGPQQGRPQRRDPLGGQEHRGCWSGQAVQCRWLTPSVWQSPSPSWWTPSAPASWPTRRSRQAVEKVFDLTRRHHPRPRPAQAHLPQAGCPMATWARTWAWWENTDRVEELKAAVAAL